MIVVSADGRDRFGPDDEATLTIFAGYAAQAIVNFEHLDQLNRQQARARAPARQPAPAARGQRAPALDPRPARASSRLIADSLKTIVPYDALTIYRCDCEAGVRRAVVARDRFAEVILDYAGPIGVGITGWVIEHGEAALTNDAHLDPRVGPDPGHAVRAGVDDRRAAPGRRRGDRDAEHRADGRSRRPTSARTSSS